MPFIDAVLAELDQEARTTLRVLERVPNDRLDWTPHPKSMSLGKLAWHVAAIPARVLIMLRQGRFDLAAAGPATPPDQVAAIVAGFHQHLEEFRAYLGSIDDAALMEPFTLVRGPQTIFTLPKKAIIRTILLNHTYHHRGQLAVYLRLLDIPVPAIYGTSADEPMGSA